MGNNIGSFTGQLDSVAVGQTVLVSARAVAGGKYQLEFAEKLVDRGESSTNALGMFNAADERFSTGGPRRGWMSVEPVNCQELLGIDVTAGPITMNEAGQQVTMLNVLNPALDNGTRLRVQVTETLQPSEWQMANLDRAAKRKGKEGEFITHQGKYIFANTDIVLGEPKHTFLTPDAPAQTTGGIIANQNVNVATGELLS